MILDQSNNKNPYMIAIAGSLILLEIYAWSRTIGISNLGTESGGSLDAVVPDFKSHSLMFVYIFK